MEKPCSSIKGLLNRLSAFYSLMLFQHTMLTLTSDQPCNWQEIKSLLQSWNSATTIDAPATAQEAHFTTPLPSHEPGRLNALLGLQETLRPYGISFSLEIMP